MLSFSTMRLGINIHHRFALSAHRFLQRGNVQIPELFHTVIVVRVPVHIACQAVRQSDSRQRVVVRYFHAHRLAAYARGLLKLCLPVHTPQCVFRFQAFGKQHVQPRRRKAYNILAVLHGLRNVATRRGEDLHCSQVQNTLLSEKAPQARGLSLFSLLSGCQLLRSHRRRECAFLHLVRLHHNALAARGRGARFGRQAVARVGAVRGVVCRRAFCSSNRAARLGDRRRGQHRNAAARGNVHIHAVRLVPVHKQIIVEAALHQIAGNARRVNVRLAVVDFLRRGRRALVQQNEIHACGQIILRDLHNRRAEQLTHLALCHGLRSQLFQVLELVAFHQRGEYVAAHIPGAALQRHLAVQHPLARRAHALDHVRAAHSVRATHNFARQHAQTTEAVFVVGRYNFLAHLHAQEFARFVDALVHVVAFIDHARKALVLRHRQLLHRVAYFGRLAVAVCGCTAVVVVQGHRVDVVDAHRARAHKLVFRRKPPFQKAGDGERLVYLFAVLCIKVYSLAHSSIFLPLKIEARVKSGFKIVFSLFASQAARAARRCLPVLLRGVLRRKLCAHLRQLKGPHRRKRCFPGRHALRHLGRQLLRAGILPQQLHPGGKLFPLLLLCPLLRGQRRDAAPFAVQPQAFGHKVLCGRFRHALRNQLRHGLLLKALVCKLQILLHRHAVGRGVPLHQLHGGRALLRLLQPRAHVVVIQALLGSRHKLGNGHFLLLAVELHLVLRLRPRLLLPARLCVRAGSFGWVGLRLLRFRCALLSFRFLRLRGHFAAVHVKQAVKICAFRAGVCPGQDVRRHVFIHCFSSPGLVGPCYANGPCRA
nr:MAG TPA: hypothetical protein [Caudoviricetes sp.]